MNILILAYDFPPLISISGQRPFSWYKYLPVENFKVTVITRHWSKDYRVPVDYIQPVSDEIHKETDGRGNTVVRVPFTPNLRDRFLLKFGFDRLPLIRRALSFTYSFLQYLCLSFDNKGNIFNEAENHICNNKVDCIIATGEPFILFRYAHLLSKKHHLEWIADYRDLWTGNQGNYKHGLRNRLQRLFFMKLERQYLSNVSMITTAAPGYAIELRKYFPAKDIYVVYNGYDEEFFSDHQVLTPPKDKFIITYTGIIYPHQNVEMFLDGLDLFLSTLSKEQCRLEVHFLGLELWRDAIQRIRNYKPHLQEYISFQSKIPYADMAKKLQQSHLLLLLSKHGVNWLNAKVFDYLAAKRKVLLVENDEGVLERLLDETKGGESASSAEEVCQILKKEYEGFVAGAFEEVNSNERYKFYSRKHQAELFGKILIEKFNAAKS